MGYQSDSRRIVRNLVTTVSKICTKIWRGEVEREEGRKGGKGGKEGGEREWRRGSKEKEGIIL